MANVRLGAKAVGSIVKIKVNGAAKDFIIVHQGKPSSVYDDSCNGTWLLMKDIYEKRQWNRTNTNDYAGSTTHSYLNDNFYNLIDSEIRAAIKQVKIPYQKGTGWGSLATGENGLSTKVFLLSGYEVGWAHNALPKDGAKLDYFGSGSGGNSKRVAYNGSNADIWWLRSPYTVNRDTAWTVLTDGSCDNNLCEQNTCGVRPALILPSTLWVSDDGTVSTNTAPSTPWNISVPSSIMGGTNISISWAKSSDDESNLAGYKVERSTDGGWSWSRIYQGTATSTTDSIAFGTTSVMYRVKAYDTDGLESGWRTSSRVTVVNNNAPSAPPSIAVPKDVKGGSTLVISWTAASDSDGNLSGYILERSTDGGSAYTQVYKGNALTYTDTIANGWSTVMYRVKAYDTGGMESGYTTSAIRTVRYNVAPALADFCRHVLPDRRIIQRVVGCFRLERGIIRDGSGHLQDRHSNVTIHGQRGGQGHTCTGNALGERCVQAGALLAIVRGDLNGMGAVQDAQEAVGGAGLFKGQRSTACKAGTGVGGLTVKFFGDGQRVTVGISNGIGEVEGYVLLSQIRGAGVDGRNIVFENQTASAGAAFNFRISVERGASGEGGYIDSVSGAFQ